MDAQSDQPPIPVNSRIGVIGWLRINLGMTILLFSLVSSGLGALVSGTLRVAATDYHLADLIRVTAEQQRALDQLHADMIDVDKRLNSGITYSNDLRRSRDSEVATLQQRVAVLEAQLRFFADRAPTSTVGTRR